MIKLEKLKFYHLFSIKCFNSFIKRTKLKLIWNEFSQPPFMLLKPNVFFFLTYFLMLSSYIILSLIEFQLIYL